MVLALFAVGMALGVDRAAQSYIVERVPYVQNLAFLEETGAVRGQLDRTLR